MPKPPHDRPVFFVDRSLGGKIVPDALLAHGWAIERHDSHFSQDTNDEVWITDVGKRKWVILTADARIRYNPLERDALLSSNTHVFVLAGRKNKTGAAMAQHFIMASADILAAIEKTEPPAVFKVHDKGKIEQCLAAPKQSSKPKKRRQAR